MSKLAQLLAGLCVPATLSLAVAGGTPQAHTPQASAAGDLRCEVRATLVKGGVELEAIASAGRAVEGSYSFDVEKSGPSGDSSIAQAGDFSLAPGGEHSVGFAGLGLTKADSYAARLRLTEASGAILCEAHGAQ